MLGGTACDQDGDRIEPPEFVEASSKAWEGIRSSSDRKHRNERQRAKGLFNQRRRCGGVVFEDRDGAAVRCENRGVDVQMRGIRSNSSSWKSRNALPPARRTFDVLETTTSANSLMKKVRGVPGSPSTTRGCRIHWPAAKRPVCVC